MAGRYATALFELALDNKAVDAVKADLEKFEAMIAESPDLHRLVRSPVFGADEQARALAAVLAKEAFWHLDAPVDRVCVEDVPMPYHPVLLEAVLPSTSLIVQRLHHLLVQ